MLSGRSLFTSGLPGCHRLLEVHHRGERLVVDNDQLRGIVGQVPIIGDHHRDRLPGIGGLLGCDRELLGHLLLVRRQTSW